MLLLQKHDKKMIGLVLTPSWFSGLLAVVIGLFITVGVIVVFSLSTSSIQHYLLSWQQSQAKPVQPVVYNPTVEQKPTIQNSWSLLLVWGVVGLIVYAISTAVIHSLDQARGIKNSLQYVNANPGAIIANAIENIVLRVVAAVALGILLAEFIKKVIPYSITAAHASAVDFFSLSGVLYAFLAFAMIVVSLHLQTVFLRLSLGKVRIFSDAEIV